jgi:hypothetical protein
MFLICSRGKYARSEESLMRAVQFAEHGGPEVLQVV